MSMLAVRSVLPSQDTLSRGLGESRRREFHCGHTWTQEGEVAPSPLQSRPPIQQDSREPRPDQGWSVPAATVPDLPGQYEASSMAGKLSRAHGSRPVHRKHERSFSKNLLTA